MYQLATEGGGFGPRGLGVPGVDDNNKKTYVYDIDHRTNQCIATIKLMDISAVDASVVEACPISTGAKVTGTGDIAGYDMYGQYQKETLAGASVLTYSSIAYAPPGTLWVNEFGLPYRHAANAGLPADVTYVAPSDPERRGTFTYGGDLSEPTEVTLDYTVDRVNMFGDHSDLFASGDPIADVTMAGTVDNTGAVAITVTQVADSSSHITFTGPAPAFPVTVDNAAGTVNALLGLLWIQQYARPGNQLLDEVIDGLIAGTTENGTAVIVDLTGSPQQSAQTSAPQPPASDYDDYGPFPMSNQGTFTVHKHKSDASQHQVGFDVDADPDHEVCVPLRTTLNFLPGMSQLSQDSYDAIRAKLNELNMGDIGDKQ